MNVVMVLRVESRMLNMLILGGKYDEGSEGKLSG